jgi:hypothetical protein
MTSLLVISQGTHTLNIEGKSARRKCDIGNGVKKKGHASSPLPHRGVSI